MFWNNQSQNDKDEYINSLKIIGSISELFSTSDTPYLSYRIHENLFCHVFNAKNMSRDDSSFDAIKNGVGIGLKTFLNSNGKTFQKVAEFNANSNEIRKLQGKEDIAKYISKLRNDRLRFALEATGTTQMYYHLVTRDTERMIITETPMEFIDIDSIKVSSNQNKNTVKFSDKFNEYSFSLSKSTLLQRFITTEDKSIIDCDVKILDNPFLAISDMSGLHDGTKVIVDAIDPMVNIVHMLPDKLYVENIIHNNIPYEDYEHIILPLYSPKDGEVSKRSGLNQWNARGRARHHNEVYIPIPSWIHTTFPDFFEYSLINGNPTQENSPSFSVELPDGHVISCRVVQQKGKALMSNPNRELGEWLLRKVLRLEENEILTIEKLRELNVDSVKLTKLANDHYLLDFMEFGSFEEFTLNHQA